MKFLAALLCSLSVATSVFAAPASRESIDKLMMLTHMNAVATVVPQQIDNIMKKGIDQKIKALNLPQNAQQFLLSFRNKAISELKQEVSWEKMSPLYARIYAKTFTQQEINDLVTFYQSPTGKMMVAKMPLVTNKSMAITQQLMAPQLKKIEASYQAALEKAKAMKNPAAQ